MQPCMTGYCQFSCAGTVNFPSLHNCEAQLRCQWVRKHDVSTTVTTLRSRHPGSVATRVDRPQSWRAAGALRLLAARLWIQASKVAKLTPAASITAVQVLPMLPGVTRTEARW